MTFLTILLVILIIGAAGWFISEIIEVFGSGFTSLSLYISIGTFFLLGIGIWRLYIGNENKDLLSLVDTIMISAGYFIFTKISIPLLSSSSTEANTGNVTFRIGVILFPLGIVLFSLSIFTTQSFLVWTGMALIVFTALTFNIEFLNSRR